MRTLKGFAICTTIGIAATVGLILYQPIAERKRITNIFNSVTNSQSASFWADAIGNQNLQVEPKEAVYLSEFLMNHNGGYALPRTNSLYATLEEAARELTKNPLPKSEDNFVFRLDKKGNISEMYNSNETSFFRRKK
jgi:hypothetical protein